MLLVMFCDDGDANVGDEVAGDVGDYLDVVNFVDVE